MRIDPYKTNNAIIETQSGSLYRLVKEDKKWWIYTTKGTSSGEKLLVLLPTIFLDGKHDLIPTTTPDKSVGDVFQMYSINALFNGIAGGHQIWGVTEEKLENFPMLARQSLALRILRQHFSGSFVSSQVKRVFIALD